MPEKTPSTGLKEAYLSEMLGEVLMLNKELHQLREESMMRIGITQQIIDEQLTASREALHQYTQAANAHFASKKQEIHDLASHQLKNAILDAHHKFLAAHPPKISIWGILTFVALSCALSLLISIAFIFFFSF